MVILYSTDFEHTVRDNRKVTYEIDLSQSKLIIPIESMKNKMAIIGILGTPYNTVEQSPFGGTK